MGIWAILNCVLFFICGVSFLTVGYCYPEMIQKEIDTAKLAANVATAAVTQDTSN